MKAVVLYQNLTKDGAICLKNGKIVINDMNAALRFIDSMIEESGIGEQNMLVLITCEFQERVPLSATQALSLWEELAIAFAKREKEEFANALAEYERKGGEVQ